MRFIEPVELHTMTPHERACIAAVIVPEQSLEDMTQRGYIEEDDHGNYSWVIEPTSSNSAQHYWDTANDLGQ